MLSNESQCLCWRQCIPCCVSFYVPWCILCYCDYTDSVSRSQILFNIFREAFKLFDRNRDGFIDMRELKKVVYNVHDVHDGHGDCAGDQHARHHAHQGGARGLHEGSGRGENKNKRVLRYLGDTTTLKTATSGMICRVWENGNNSMERVRSKSRETFEKFRKFSFWWAQEFFKLAN